MSKSVQLNKIIFFLYFFSFLILKSQSIEITPMYNTIGVKVSNIDFEDSCILEYKQALQSNWMKAFYLDKININNADYFRGSIFSLQENNDYDIKVTLYKNGIPNVLPINQTKTLLSPNFNPTSNQKWVSPNGTGNFTQANPGNLKTLFSSGQVICGTTIILTDGIYNSTEMQLNVTSSCTDNTPILLISAPGANPIIEGGTKISSTWTTHSTIQNLYTTNLPTNTSHSSVCVVGNKSIYPYPTLNSDPLFGNYNLSDLNFGYDGFVRDENTIWIKTLSGINPNDSEVIVSNSWRFLTIYGNNKNLFLKFKGITFQHFGKPKLNSIGSGSDAFIATVFDIRNAHHVYFDSCSFIHNVSHISFTNICNNLTIQNTNFKSDFGKWTHAMIKKSLDNSFFVSTTRGRNIETEALFFDQGKSICVRNNYFDGTNSGIQSYYNQGLKEEIDVYNNIFIDNFDAIECDGLWSNLRVWKNEIVRPMAAISASPPLIGPRYFYRNIIHGMEGRRNEADDPYFIECGPVNRNYKGQAVGLKTNPIYTGSISKGNLYFFNNTFHSSDSLGFVFTSWESEWRKAIFINNSYSHQTSYPFFYFNLANTSSNNNFQISSQNENYYSFNQNSPIVKVKLIHGQYNCTNVYDATLLQSSLSNISGSSNIVINNPSQLNPFFINTNIGGFMLTYNSPLIDKGIIIQGFNDFYGSYPDIGANEYIPTSNVQNELLKDIIIYPNPSNNILLISHHEKNEIISINIFDCLGQKVSSFQNFDGKEIELSIKELKEGIYFIEIKTNDNLIVKKIIKINK